MSHKKAKRDRISAQQNVRAMLHRYVANLREVFKRNAPAMYAAGPELPRPCHTCAFNPKTDTWAGFDQTMMRMERAIAWDQPFFCHENLPRREITNDWYYDGGPLEPCAGWLAIRNDPDARRAYARAVVPEVELTDAQVDYVIQQQERFRRQLDVQAMEEA